MPLVQMYSRLNHHGLIEGPSFGSGNIVRLKAPNIAMAWDSPSELSERR